MHPSPAFQELHPPTHTIHYCNSVFKNFNLQHFQCLYVYMKLHYLKRPNATLCHISISALHLTCIYPSTDWCLSSDSLTCQTYIGGIFLKVYAKIKIIDTYIKPINIKWGQPNESQFQTPLWDTIWSSLYVTVLSPQLLSGHLPFHHVTNALEFLSCYSHTNTCLQMLVLL